MPTALVTGASSGLGAEFARQLAERGQDLVLVARDTARLEESARRLHAAYAVDVEVLTADLAQREELERVAERLRDPGRPVDLLVNNAGFARRTRIVADLVEEERAVDVMLRPVLVLSHAAAAAMTARGRGAVLNVSSIAAFVALGSYSATKSWVLLFSEALAHELSGTGVTVTATCPGFVHTEFHERAGLSMSMLPSFGWLDAGRVVADSLSAVDRGRVVVIPSRRFRLLALVFRQAPRPLLRRVTGALAQRRRARSGAAS